MTDLTITKLGVPSAEMNGTSSLPQLFDVKFETKIFESDLGEDDGLFLNYSRICSAFPYKTQDCYSRELTGEDYDAIVLENEHLRAVFVPGLGGKLWSLYDKDADRELLFANHVFRPAYLALRNAWASGGVEWNCGAIIGHNPFTCDQMFTAIISKENSGLGCPVLRMYNYERIRAVTYQMDFYLPEDAHFLHCRTRVVNDNKTVTPMYWWSNIAVPSDENARCVVPADFAFTPVNGAITRVPVPAYNNVDVSYPTQNPIAVDYFFKTYDNRRHYTSHLDAEGYGLVQTSTARLKGRKLFIWGRGQGGARWQEYLSGDDGKGKFSDGRYCEIQCGLAHSQYEYLPMPQKTAWEWMEYYGPMKADPKRIHGEWHDAQAELEACLDAAVPMDMMEKELCDTHKMAVTPADKVIAYGDPWAALEERTLSAHLDFGELKEDQLMWNNLVRTGSLRYGNNDDASKAPISYQRRENWIARLEKAADGPDKYFWLTHYMLGCAYIANRNFDKAEKALDASCKLNTNAWNTYATAELYRVLGKNELSSMTILAAARMAPDNDDLCKKAAGVMAQAQLWDVLRDYVSSLSDDQRKLPRIRLYSIMAAVNTGNIDEADELLNADGGLEIPDIMEGEISITDVWYSIEEKKAARDGRPFDRKTAKPPKKFDFRMNVSE